MQMPLCKTLLTPYSLTNDGSPPWNGPACLLKDTDGSIQTEESLIDFAYETLYFLEASSLLRPSH